MKVKKLTIGKLQKILWEHCKRIIRKIYQRDDGKWECYTCGRIIESPQDAHTAHFLPRSTCGAYLKYDLRNLRVCCMTCNVWLGGNGAEYYRRMVTREGQEYVDQLFRDKQKTVKAYEHYQNQLKEYESKEI